MKNEKWFAKEISQIERQLNTNAATGLSRKAARSRSNKNFGQLFLLPLRSPARILLSLCTDFSLIMLLILCVQITFVYFGGTVLRTVPLTARELTVTALLSAAVIPAELIRKALWRLRGHKTGF